MKTKLILGCLIAASAAFSGWKIFACQNNTPLTDLQLANAEALASPERSGDYYADCLLLSPNSPFKCKIKCPSCKEDLYPEGNPSGITDDSTIEGTCPICGYRYSLNN